MLALRIILIRITASHPYTLCYNKDADGVNCDRERLQSYKPKTRSVSEGEEIENKKRYFLVICGVW